MTKRLFVSISLPDNVKAELIRHYRQFSNLSDHFTQANNLHLTVLFLGNVSEPKMDTLNQKLTAVAKDFPVFNITLKDLAFAPPGRHPRMVWADFEPVPEFTELSNQVFETLDDFIRLEPKKKAVPHVTLIRFPALREAPSPRYLPVKKLTFPANAIRLVSSDLQPEGPIYTILKTFPLATPKR